MVVISVQSVEEAQEKIKTCKLVVIDFFATWCGPCKIIGPKVEKMSEELPEVTFLKVDVDDCEDAAEAFGVQAMPTFKIYKDGTKVDELVGANEQKLRSLVEKHAGTCK